MTMPQQRPGRSKQDYRTPTEFLTALKRKLGIQQFSIDLAASTENAVADILYTEEDNSLNPSLKWDWGGWAFLNPPYSNIEPWAIKAVTESAMGAHIAMLVPASVGSNWWRDYVDGIAYTLFLNGRITFTGATAPYPKDCVVNLYTPWLRGGGHIWSWED